MNLRTCWDPAAYEAEESEGTDETEAEGTSSKSSVACGFAAEGSLTIVTFRFMSFRFNAEWGTLTAEGTPRVTIISLIAFSFNR